jgi:HEAT repeat protein
LLEPVLHDDLAFQDFAPVLSNAGPIAGRAFLDALNHDDYQVRARAARILGSMGRRKLDAVPGTPWKVPSPEGKLDEAIFKALDERNARLYGATALAKDSPELLEGTLSLLEALHEKYEHPNIGSSLRIHALGTLTRIGPIGRVAVADMFWSDERAANLVSAEMALGGLTGSSGFAGLGSNGFAALADALASADPPLRARLAPQMIPELTAILRDPRRRGSGVAKALGQFGPAAADAVPALLAVLRKNHDAEAAWALGRIGPAAKDAVPHFKRLLEEHIKLSRAAASRKATVGRNWEAPIPSLRRVEFADALLRIAPKEKELALARLKNTLKAADPYGAMTAAVVLFEQNAGNADAFEALLYSGPGPLTPWAERRDLIERLSRLHPEAKKSLLKVGRPFLQSAPVSKGPATPPPQRFTLPDNMPLSPDAKRRAAACVLAPFDPDACLPILLEILKQGNAVETVEAEKVLSRLGPKAKPAFPQLQAMLAQASKSFFAADSHMLVHALAEIDPDAAVRVLFKTWRQPSEDGKNLAATSNGIQGKFFLYGRFSTGPEDCFQELLGLGSRLKFALSDLIADLKSTEHESNVMPWSRSKQEAAGMLLAKMGAAALPALVEMTRDSKAALQTRAAEVLARMGADARAAVPALLQLLHAGEAKVRSQAAAALGRIAPDDKEVLAALIRVSKDKDLTVRRPAVRALGGAGATAVPVLAEALSDPDENIVLAAVGSLGRIGREAAPLRSAREHKKVQVRRLAVLALGRLGPDVSGAIAALVDAVRDPDPLVRRLAVSLLDEPGKEIKLVLPAVAKALADENRQVRWTAAFTIEKLAGQASQTVPALQQCLQDTDSAICRRVLFALRAMGPAAKSATPDIVRLLIDRGKVGAVGAVQEVDLHADAIAALLCIEPDPVGVFLGLLKSSSSAGGTAAAEAFIRIGAPAVPALLPLTRNGELDVRKRAVYCLGQISPPPQATVPALVTLLEDNRLLIRLEAISALAALGPDAREAIAPLTRIANDNSDVAREAAAKALQRIGP